METIYHITTRSAWEAAVTAGVYRAASLTSEGFIHCSTEAQVVSVADALYRGQADLLLLRIDSARLTAQVVYEDCYESGQAFPHIYGPLPVTAVTATAPFPPRDDGAFAWPTAWEPR